MSRDYVSARAWLLVALLVACRAGEKAPATARLEFVDAAAEVGLGAFHQVNGSPEKRHIVDSTGAGAALLDYDGDGDLNVFLVNGSRERGVATADAPSNALFRNEGHGTRFVDVTAEAGLESRGAWGQGVAAADVDGDGHLDLYVTNHGPNALYLGSASGRFRDATAAAGVGNPGWSTGAAFLDYDGDGDLDLYVANYVDWDAYIAAHPAGIATSWKGMLVFGGPKGLPAAPDRLYRNEGDASFTDVSHEAGIDGVPPTYSFQPVVLDYDEDGKPDLFVATDTSGNLLWHNQGDGTFRDRAGEAGVKLDERGNGQASMGVAVGDHDGDGRDDLFVTVFSEDLNTLYRAAGTGQFDVATATAGLGGAAAFAALGWGTAFLDADADGLLDLVVANGHVYPQADKAGSGQSYAQRARLYRQQRAGRFADVTDAAGSGFAPARSARGVAGGDVDGDGDVDVLVNVLDGTPVLLRNASTGAGRSLIVSLRGRAPNPSAVGARVTVTVGARKQTREVRAGGSFLSQSDLRLHFGLGTAEAADRVEMRWPRGGRQELSEVKAGEVVIEER